MLKSDRFAFIKSEDCPLGLGISARVVVDKKTGVNYLFVQSGYSGGLTPLLDREGKPVIAAAGTFEQE